MISFKYRPKARRRVKKGHRQDVTVLRITEVRLGAKSAAAEKRYDLRPLLSGIRLERGPDGAAGEPIVAARTRFHPELGAGRPDEVVAALAEASGLPLEVRSLTRTGLLLAEGPRRN